MWQVIAILPYILIALPPLTAVFLLGHAFGQRRGRIKAYRRMREVMPVLQPAEGHSRGALQVHVPRSLHHQLVDAAAAESVSLDTFVTATLAQAVMVLPRKNGVGSGHAGQNGSVAP